MEVEIAQKHNQKSDALKQISGLVILTVVRKVTNYQKKNTKQFVKTQKL